MKRVNIIYVCKCGERAPLLTHLLHVAECTGDDRRHVRNQSHPFATFSNPPLRRVAHISDIIFLYTNIYSKLIFNVNFCSSLPPIPALRHHRRRRVCVRQTHSFGHAGILFGAHTRGIAPPPTPRRADGRARNKITTTAGNGGRGLPRGVRWGGPSDCESGQL